jgi:glycosyltransferase involved in cell wall biosynthesis
LSRDESGPAGASDLPLISVVIPCFNYANYVEAAIASVLSQDYPRTEVIVVNDGSTDGSLTVISRYAGQVAVLDQSNAGHVAACNAGFASARGTIVMFLDADDLLASGALSRVANAWSPRASKVQFDLTIIDGRGRDLGRRFCNFPRSYDVFAARTSFNRTGTYRWPVMSGNAYSRWFLERVFPLAVARAPDGFLNTVAPVYGDVITIPEALGCYRLHGANRSTRGSARGSGRPPFPERIALRRRELGALRSHAEKVGVALPSGDILDRELTLLNYRLMALKLGLDYEGRAADSVPSLLGKAVRGLADDISPLKARLAHLVWFLALSASPAAAADSLIDLRFRRTGILRAASARGLAVLRSVGRAT